MKRFLAMLGLVLLVSGCGDDETMKPEGNATKLTFEGVPASVTPGTGFSLNVRAERSDGSLDADYTGTVTLSKQAGPGTLSGTLSRAAVAGVAAFSGLMVSDPGDYTFAATSGSLTAAASPTVNAGNPPTVLWTGSFAGQNGYTAAGMFDILESGGIETFKTRADFHVSMGLGSISIWLTNAMGGQNLNSTTTKVRLGTLTATTGFQGIFTYPILAGSAGYTHVVTYCDGAQINVGSAAFVAP